MNVVCILLDTLRRDHLGSYGNEWIETPNLDRLASDGAKFENCYLGSYPCMPARQDLWTGELNFLRRGWSPLEHDQDDLITLLRQNNKPSMLVTDHYHLWQYGSGNYHFGFNGVEMIRGQERDNWITNPDIPIQYPASSEKLNRDWESYARNTAHFQKEEDYFAAQVFQKSMDWVEQNRNLKDFFLMIDCFDPHEPFDPPPGYVEKYDPDYKGDAVIWPKTGTTEYLSTEELNHIHALYCGEVTYVDHWFGKFYDKLESLGLLDNTMVIVTSDHGFLFGEHDWLGKHARILYQDIARTPLIIRSPTIKPGTTYNELVQMPDLTPTILQALGVVPSNEMHGKSLHPIWNQEIMQDDEIRSRTEIIFGVYGGPVYCTDGEWLLVKKPVQGNFPLYWYSKSHYNNWDFGQVNYLDDNKQRAEQWDGERFPVQYENVRCGHAPPRMVKDTGDLRTYVSQPQDELYHIRYDHGQTMDLAHERADVVEYMRTRMSALMTEYNSPKEQWTRLGLQPGELCEPPRNH